MRISTKTGDKGETGLFTSKRVKKNHILIGTLGDLDELHSFLGLARFGLETGGEAAVVERIQDDLYRIMGIVGSEMKVPPSIQGISSEDVDFLEATAKTKEEAIGGLRKFIRPGTSEAAARLHVARSVCRRAERSLVNAMEEFGGEENVLKYLNRLSDLLFVLACSYEKEIIT